MRMLVRGRRIFCLQSAENNAHLSIFEAPSDSQLYNLIYQHPFQKRAFDIELVRGWLIVALEGCIDLIALEDIAQPGATSVNRASYNVLIIAMRAIELSEENSVLYCLDIVKGLTSLVINARGQFRNPLVSPVTCPTALCLLDNEVFVGDTSGQLYRYRGGGNELTIIDSICIGEEVTAISVSGPRELLYGTKTGRLSRLTLPPIDPDLNVESISPAEN